MQIDWKADLVEFAYAFLALDRAGPIASTATEDFGPRRLRLAGDG